MDPTRPPHERAPPDLPASAEEPRRSEALEAELAALEAMLPGGPPAAVPEPGDATAPDGDQPAASPPRRPAPPVAGA